MSPYDPEQNKLHIRLPQPPHDIFFRRYRVILPGIARSKAMGQTRNLRVKVGVTEESDGLTLGSNGFKVVERFRGRGNDAMEGRT